MFGNLLYAIPPVTRFQVILISVLTLLVSSESISKYDMYFSWDRILSGQVWRFITSWMFYKNIDIYFTFKMFMFVQFSAAIQKSAFKRGSIDHIHFLIMLFTGLLFVASVLSISYLTNIYFYTVCYFYGRINKNQLVLLNLIPMRAPFISWYFVMISFVVGDHDLHGLIIAILLGHILYFVIQIYPNLKFRVWSKDLFDTPQFLVDFLTPYLGRDLQNQNQQGLHGWGVGNAF